MKTKIIALLATGLLLMSLVGPAFAAPFPLVTICHVDDTGNGHVMTVGGNAPVIHLAAHGDDFLVLLAADETRCNDLP